MVDFHFNSKINLVQNEIHFSLFKHILDEFIKEESAEYWKKE